MGETNRASHKSSRKHIQTIPFSSPPFHCYLTQKREVLLKRQGGRERGGWRGGDRERESESARERERERARETWRESGREGERAHSAHCPMHRRVRPCDWEVPRNMEITPHLLSLCFTFRFDSEV